MLLTSLNESYTENWLEEVEPNEIKEKWGCETTHIPTGPLIIAQLIESGQLDDQISELLERGFTAEEVAWELIDEMFNSTW